MRYYLPYNKEFTGKARELRNHMTLEESKLWYQFLRDCPIRFSRQKQVDKYILDFYCAKVRLCIEIDGNQHLSNNIIEHDNERKWDLDKYGIKTLRYSNEQIKNEFSSVCKKIDNMIQQLLQAQNKTE